MNNKSIKLIQPDDWHVHIREDEMLEAVIKYSMRINKRCVIMPNLKTPVNNSDLAKKYLNQVKIFSNNKSFEPLLPCFLTENLDLKDFENSLKNNIFFGAKLYPSNATNNSDKGISNVKKMYKAFEILNKVNKPLLIHGEKVSQNIDIFDREKYFIDDELLKINKNFPNLKVVLEHVSTEYGANYVNETNNLAGTITPQHMLLTKKDVFNGKINPHHYCMPIVKDEKDLLALRNYACSGNKSFFLGTDSAPHDIKHKENVNNISPGIFSAPCSLELYAQIFEDENCLDNLEKFTSINGPKFYNLPVNEEKIKLVKDPWVIDEFTIFGKIVIKNFFGGKKINWKIQN